MRPFRTAITVLAVAGLAACEADSTAPIRDIAPSLNVSAGGDASGTYLVRFKGNGVPAGFAAKVSALGGEVIFAHAGVGVGAVGGLDDGRAGQLAGVSGVAAVDPDAVTLIDNPQSLEVEADNTPESPSNPAIASFILRQWHMNAISAPTAWAAGKLGSPTLKIGVLDTGIDYLHPDTYGKVDFALSKSFLSAAENARVPAGAHPVADLHYHGTHVASTIVSNGRIAAGVTSGPMLVGLKVCAPGTAANGFTASCPTSAVLSAILYSADIGLDIINMSLGGTFDRRDASAKGGVGPSFIATIQQVMNYANRKGVTIVVSAGNSAIDMDHDGNGFKAYCSASAVICVSGTGPTAGTLVAPPSTGRYINIQNIDALASYSNFGRSAISVAAPGGNVLPVWAVCSGFTLHPALASCRTRSYNPTTGAGSGSVLGLAGTSMASPHAAGVAALIASEGVSGPSAIAARLRKTSDDLGQPGSDPAYGHGRINAARAAGLM